jgi:uncharacterized protein YbjT (DUF2867 family)/uncharacterized protein YndB with AHSA1/START domain
MRRVPDATETNLRRILLTGATGYIGGRLLRRLEARGLLVRCLVRRAAALEGRVASTTEVAEGDVLDRSSLARVLDGIHTAYYLIHSMGSGKDFAERDREAANHFGEESRRSGVERIVYLGGLGQAGPGLSEHLRSRQETGDVLRECGVPVVEFRASIVLGSGSLSFEMIRALVDRLPVMVWPSWVSRPTQPIAIDDVLAYLLAALDLPAGTGRIYEIGGPDRVSYGDLMREYARQRGLRRIYLPVPLLTPRLSSLWLGLVTPLYARVGRKLIEGVRNATVVRDESALSDFAIRPVGVREAISRAISSEGQSSAETRWSQSRSSSAIPARPEDSRRPTRTFLDERRSELDAPPEAVFAAVSRLGGSAGWYSHGLLWRIRGILDLLFGGVGYRRGRRHPDELVPGDYVDFWRVEAVEAPRRLRLEAEMRLPGRAWLEFEVEPRPGGGSRLRQTATFEARGLSGKLYWWVISPFHHLVFGGLLAGIASRATRADASDLSRSGPGPRSRRSSG